MVMASTESPVSAASCQSVAGAPSALSRCPLEDLRCIHGRADFVGEKREGFNLGFQNETWQGSLGAYRSLESLYPFLYPRYFTMVHNGGCMDINPNREGGSRF